MKNKILVNTIQVFGVITISSMFFYGIAIADQQLTKSSEAPIPLLQLGHPVDWWFIFKFNSKSFPLCGDDENTRICNFGGTVQNYSYYSQQFVYASSDSSFLKKGIGCLGASEIDPLSTTFKQIYENNYNYVLWNDQFYDDPVISGCSKACSAPWAHSKGVLAWNEKGDGLVMQVTTPSWPASGSKNYPRNTDGNTLGCIKDNNVLLSQHFFALKLNKEDVVKILTALKSISVVTNPHDPQIVRNGGPGDIQELVNDLGQKSGSTFITNTLLSSGVLLIAKPASAHIPPWHLVSAELNGQSLRVATWWSGASKIPGTTDTSEISCWDDALHHPGAVINALTGQWEGNIFGLKGGPGQDFNHSKIGVSSNYRNPIVIFGDMNQQGALSGKCDSSQNGRGGLFYVVTNTELFKSVSQLIEGESGFN